MDFTKPYNRAEWIDFLETKFMPNDFNINVEENIHVEHKYDYIKEVNYLGESERLGGKVYEIKHISAYDPRISLTRESFKLMSSYGESKALVLFTTPRDKNYRFSLITIDLKVEDGKVKEEISNPKRYSFILGEDTKIHTPEEYLVEKGRVIDFNDLQNRFSIEVVNKEFYNEIAILFTKLTGGIRKIGNRIEEFGPKLRLPSGQDHEALQRFAVRLIGRIVFCWFLKKKKSEDNKIALVPEDILSVQAIEKNNNYYHKILEPLFFEVLNTQMNERKEFIKNEEKWNNIPFLNGGLFDPNLHQDFYEIDEDLNRSKYENTLKVPDEWLKELFEIFETYNFTIDENTSVDIDISVDPEMLGRIFENLLAEINPETEKSARKSTGSYYTPRPIVEYMVDESLIQYLITKLSPLERGGSDLSESGCVTTLEQKIRNLLNYTIEESSLNNEETEQVIDALDEVKILDPACGSGAFPMGMLQKMLLILEKVDPGSMNWLIKQLDKISNPAVKKAVEEELTNKDWKYIHKMGIIQNAIYGVDIQPIAVELSKLRFFLTIVVDEKIDDNKDNRGVNPLPNLSFKFVAANTLIGLPKLELQGDAFERKHLEPIIKKMNKLRSEFFHSTKKESIEREFGEEQKRLGEFIARNGSQNKLAVALANWEPFTEKSSDWFDPWWMFGIKDGFDIVIGNPPYISYYSRQAKIIKKEFLNYYQNNYEFLQNNRNKKSINTVMLFLEKAIKILSENAVLTYIIDIGFFEKVYKEIRTYLSKYDVNRIITDISAFENVNSGQIIIFISKIESQELSCKIFKDFEESTIYINKDMFVNDTLTLCESEDVTLDRINTIQLNKICKITCGLEYGALRNLFISKTKLNAKYHTVLNRGKNLPSKYLIKYDDENDGFVLFDKEFEEKLTEKGKNISESGKVVHFISGDESKYLEEKIIIRQSAFEIIAAYDNKNFYTLRSLFVANLINPKFNLKFILSIINSKLISYYAKQKGIIRFQKGKQPQIRVSGINILHIPDILLQKQQPFITLVDQIHIDIKQDKDIKKLEDQIDLIVYKLYELTYEEVLIVDSECPFSREEYEKYELEGVPKKIDVEKKQNSEKGINTKETKTAKVIKQKSDIIKEFYIGQHVIHPTFGEGEVQHVAGSGVTAKLTIKFGRETKKLVAGYANLRGM